MNDEEITPIFVQSKIFLIRGKQVMIDRDLAELYGVETKRITEAVKRNIERFPDEYRFQLTTEEYDFLRSQCFQQFYIVLLLYKSVSKLWMHL